ncbi:hypothetical protein SAMN05660909_05394 [Chitinophaga terrae (ex Kim and Jung 2007)]|uniref:Uncharacterized protein n=1 Tax=Chitinophaga terrae (ex Kim and Jung 2007) TaxID=408074 RepID=A0A1H4GIP1_9BACT|nr:hypothetical protein [Chitinophaga terrae (ex Kim and Jung 2007)]GEP93495.1 hypothetical protein CTE07_51400 [Chitinophaga terrae (ex Kim and Jung 2007)]SEB09475.1 hypothetical protein SAMN05660909_05394 [Chitinophaga terrae (ex Kim and Jung 2007)]
MIYEFPTENDRFFVPDSGVQKTYASINRTKGLNNDNALLFIGEGYQSASIILLNEIIENHNEDWMKIDSLIYPILFSFRHYLEIVIKDTLRNHKLISGDTYSDEIGFPPDHDLFKLWERLKPYLDKTYEHSDTHPAQMTVLEKLITEFNDVDKGSYSFRYPFNRPQRNNDDIVFSLEAMTINLLNLKSTFEKMIFLLGSINEHSKVLLDIKQTI